MRTILTHVDYYLPGTHGGGSTRTVTNMAGWLGDDVDFRILTRDHDLGSDQPYQDIMYGAWNPVGNAHVRYLSQAEMGMTALARLLRQIDYDMLYLNSFFSAFSVKLAWIHQRKPIILAPRGEFNTGALMQKPAKKRRYLALARASGIYRNVTWQASTTQERDEIRALFPGADVMIARNLPPCPLPEVPPHTDFSPPLRIVFLSRISPKKNLEYALRVLGTVEREVVFHIYGPQEDPSYWQTCQHLIDDLPTHIHADYLGPVHADAVVDTFSRYHLFFFPTLGENYGHVIWEALYAGCPVLVSDQTPWRDLNGVGWDLPLANPDAFRQIIETARLNDLLRMSAAGSELARDHAHDASALEANRRLLLGR